MASLSRDDEEEKKEVAAAAFSSKNDNVEEEEEEEEASAASSSDDDDSGRVCGISRVDPWLSRHGSRLGVCVTRRLCEKLKVAPRHGRMCRGSK